MPHTRVRRIVVSWLVLTILLGAGVLAQEHTGIDPNCDDAVAYAAWHLRMDLVSGQFIAYAATFAPSINIVHDNARYLEGLIRGITENDRDEARAIMQRTAIHDPRTPSGDWATFLRADFHGAHSGGSWQGLGVVGMFGELDGVLLPAVRQRIATAPDDAELPAAEIVEEAVRQIRRLLELTEQATIDCLSETDRDAAADHMLRAHAYLSGALGSKDSEPFGGLFYLIIDLIECRPLGWYDIP